MCAAAVESCARLRSGRTRLAFTRHLRPDAVVLRVQSSPNPPRDSASSRTLWPPAHSRLSGMQTVKGRELYAVHASSRHVSSPASCSERFDCSVGKSTSSADRFLRPAGSSAAQFPPLLQLPAVVWSFDRVRREGRQRALDLQPPVGQSRSSLTCRPPAPSHQSQDRINTVREPTRPRAGRASRGAPCLCRGRPCPAR